MASQVISQSFSVTFVALNDRMAHPLKSHRVHKNLAKNLKGGGREVNGKLGKPNSTKLETRDKVKYLTSHR